MRHLWSLLAGILIAPLAWLGVAAGQSGSERAVAEWQQDGLFDTAELIVPAAFLVAVGVLVGLVGTLRLSPAGPLAAGLLLVAPTVFMFINPFDALDAFSYDETSRLLGQDMQLWRPVQNGTLLVLGALLLMAVFSTGRWRRPAPEPFQPAAAEPVEASETTAPASETTAMSDEEIVAAAAAIDEPSSGSEPDTAGEERSTTGPTAADERASDEKPTDPDEPDEGAGTRTTGSGGAAS